MSWARLDDGFHDHPKVDGLSLAAVGLYTLCLTWAHRHRKTALCPGHITDARVTKVAGAQGKKLVRELVTARLWEPEEGLGGYVIHDFADYLPKERDPEERRQAGRKGAVNRWQAAKETDSNLPPDSMANGIASDSSRASARAFPTRPDPKDLPGSTSVEPPKSRTARETTGDDDQHEHPTHTPPPVEPDDLPPPLGSLCGHCDHGFHKTPDAISRCPDCAAIQRRQAHAAASAARSA